MIIKFVLYEQLPGEERARKICSSLINGEQFGIFKPEIDMMAANMDIYPYAKISIYKDDQED